MIMPATECFSNWEYGRLIRSFRYSRITAGTVCGNLSAMGLTAVRPFRPESPSRLLLRAAAAARARVSLLIMNMRNFTS